MAVKQRATEMSFVSSIGPSHPISEIGTSHIYRFNQESEGTVLYILSIKWLIGCSQVGDHEMYQK